jgi:cytochrome P450
MGSLLLLFLLSESSSGVLFFMEPLHNDEVSFNLYFYPVTFALIRISEFDLRNLPGNKRRDVQALRAMKEQLALELGFILVLSLDFFRLAVHQELRATFPRVRTLLLFLSLAWLVFLLVLAPLSPSTIHGILAVAIGLRLAGLWRDRPETGLPPGSRSPTDTIRALVELDYYEQRARQLGPIFKMAQFHHTTICVVDLKLGHRVLSEHRASLRPCPLPFNRTLCGGFLRYMDGETYKFYGPLFRKALSREVLLVGDEVRELARTQIEQVADGQSSLAEALERVTFEAFLMCLLGFDSGHPDHDEFQEIFQRFSCQDCGEPPNRKTIKALNELCNFARELRGQTRAKNALVELQRIDANMPDQVCYENIMYILRIAVANVVELLQWLVEVLAEYPQWQERIRQRGEDSDLVTRVILETLRLHQSEYLYRRVSEEFEFNGFRFPKDWLLRVCTRECHRDPRIFPSPEEFNPDRFLVRPKIDEYAPFGFLDHACNGVPLSHSICGTFLEEFADGFSLRLVKKGEPTRNFRHWSHWRPSSVICLTRLGDENSVQPSAKILLE